MTRLLSGWSNTRQVPNNSLRVGVRLQRYHTLPAGLAHAVPEGEDEALCGAPIVVTTIEWPGGTGGSESTCAECRTLAAAAVAP